MKQNNTVERVTAKELKEKKEKESIQKDFENETIRRKKIINFLFNKIMLASVFYDSLIEGKNPFLEIKRIQQDVGLATNSILGGNLWVPEKGELVFKPGNAGKLTYFDPNNSKYKTGNGVGYTHLLPELKNKSMMEETPNLYIQRLSYHHMIYWMKLNLDDALDFGALQHISYKEALEKFESRELLYQAKELNILNDTVFQVTPKGNGLIDILGDGGDSQKKKDAETEKSKLYPEGLAST